MNGNSILKYGRASVLKWAGKNFTGSGVNWNGTEGISTVQTIQAHTMLPQECNQSPIFDVSPEDQEPIKNEDFCPSNSRNAKKLHVCMVCNKTFKWRSHLECHERIHTGERPFRCDICCKAFKRSDGLQCHKKIHFKIKVDGDDAHGNSFVLDQAALKQHNIFACTICGRTFASHAGYLRHTENKHKDKDNLKCDSCNIIFNRPSALEIHSRVHTGLKPYRCSICFRPFSIHGNLKRHLLMHSGERPYKCTFCESCYNNPSHLARHKKSQHEGTAGKEEEHNKVSTMTPSRVNCACDMAH